MIYSKFITTPANTDQSNPLRTTIKVTKGLVYKVEIMFPPGPLGLLRVAIFDGAYQVWPSALGEWFRTDGETISYDDTYLKESAPFVFTVESWNEDDTYDHGVDVRIGVVSKKIFQARFLPHLSYEYMKEAMAELRAAQEAEAEKQRQEKEAAEAAALATPLGWGT